MFWYSAYLKIKSGLYRVQDRFYKTETRNLCNDIITFLNVVIKLNLNQMLDTNLVNMVSNPVLRATI